MESIIYALFVWALFFIITFYGIRKSAVKDRGDYLVRLNSMRGIFAMDVVIGHVIRYENTLLYPLGKFMMISVAFFFFISAFGMVVSFQKKENYLKGFLPSKLLYLLGLILITYFFNATVDWLSPVDIDYCYRGGNLITWILSKTNWYIVELALFYIIFYLVYKYIKKFRTLIITLITIIFINIVFRSGWILGWYASALAFPAGLIFGEHFSRVCRVLDSVWGKLLTAIFILIGAGSLWASENSIIGMGYMRNIMCLAGILLLLYFSKYFVTGNTVSRFLGKYSTEIYLFQFVFRDLSEKCQWPWQIRLPFVLTAALLAAIIIHPIFNVIKLKSHGIQVRGK